MDRKFILIRATYHLTKIRNEDDILNIFPEILTSENREYLDIILTTSNLFDNTDLGNLVIGYKLKPEIKLEITESSAELFVEKYFKTIRYKNSLWNKISNHPSLTFWIFILTLILVILTALLLK